MEPMSTRMTTRPRSFVHSGSRLTRRGLAHGAAIVLTLAGVGCDEPLEPLPSVYDMPALAGLLDEEDGIDEGEGRSSAFVHGEPVRYWSFGVGGERAMPLYRLCRAEGEEACVPIDHPPIVDRLPGDEGYAPYGQEHWVELPEGWTGRLASVEEIEAALDALGLDAPRPTSILWHCPIAGPSATLEVAANTVVAATQPIYVRGMEARCFDFSANPNRAVFPDGQLFVRNVYVLTREGEEQPLTERARMMDLTGDGDTNDSNNIFGVGLDDADYTPLWRIVRVTVPSETSSIDDTLDETQAQYQDAHDLFDVAPDYTITPIDGRVVAHELTESLLNCPLQSAEGQI